MITITKCHSAICNAIMAYYDDYNTIEYSVTTVFHKQQG